MSDIRSITFTVDGHRLRDAENRRHDGFGFISANNSSRLLLDYKAEHPESYRRILEYCFGKKGLRLNYFKFEMGADVNSTSGTEPSVKRFAEEPADLTRGAGPQLAADAFRINPELEFDMEYWGIPGWVKASPDPMDAMYRWYKETIDGLYDTYGLRLSYLTANQNERDVDTAFIKYLRKRLDEETDCRYPYSSIRLVAGEGVSHWGLAWELLKDEELRSAVDVLSAHYTSETDERVLLLQKEYGKKIWFSEGSSPMTKGSLVRFHDGNGSGISGINGTLDIAVRIILGIANGMTMYEVQPVVSAYYDGVTFCSKQLITANTPWSGVFSLDDGFYMGMHIFPFFPKGMLIAEDAVFSDGVPGGDGHAIVDAKVNYLSMVSPDRSEVSLFLANPSEETLSYTINLRNLSLGEKPLHVYKTSGLSPENADYHEGFFRYQGDMDFSGNTGKLLLPPFSMITLSTFSREFSGETDYRRPEEDFVLPLPYTDDFSYAAYPSGYLPSRGFAPRYTTDMGGAFEVAETEDGRVLQQMITEDLRGVEWGGTPDPVTNLGDDRWSDYEVSLEAAFAPESETAGNSYVGIGARYLLAADSESGYSLRLYRNETAELRKGSTVLSSCRISAAGAFWIPLRLRVRGNTIAGFVGEQECFSVTDSTGPVTAGRIAIYSSYHNNRFRKLRVQPAEEGFRAVSRLDCFDPAVSYTGSWTFNTISGFRFRNRTEAVGTENAAFAVSFYGSRVSVIGPARATLCITLDGTEIVSATSVKTGNRESVFSCFTLPEAAHTIRLEILKGNFSFDYLEFS